MKTDKEQMRLVGPVQSIRLESANYELKNGAWVEGSPELVFIITFDREGNKLDETFYCEEYPTPSSGHYETECDAKGNIVEKTFYDREVLQHRCSYTYNEDGTLTKEVAYFADGTISNITLFEYDRHREQTAMKYFKADGTPDNEYRYTNEYDEVGNLIRKVITRRNILDIVPYDQPLSVQYYIICYYI